MKIFFTSRSRPLSLFLTGLLTFLPALYGRSAETGTAQVPAPAAAEDEGWPRQITVGKVRLTCYQPQIDEWAGYHTLHARLAVSMTPPGEIPQLGVAEIVGETTADQESRMVVIRNLKVVEARFHSEKPEAATRLEALLKENFPKTPVTVSLDRMLAGVRLAKGAVPSVEVKMEPPPIFTSTTPAMLLMVEGAPVLAPAEKTGLKFVVNTNWDILFDEAGSTYYLLSGDEWLAAQKLEGPWELAGSLPAAVEKLPDDETWKHVKEELPWSVKKGMILPKVLFSDKPAELISFAGEPIWEKIPNTGLSWASNTDSDVFMGADGNIYYLVSGRWFKTSKLDEPWTYTGNALPEDFKHLPENEPYSDVLASVPGTQEAEDAVILASVPVEAVVKIKEAQAKAKAEYNGEPAFKPIEGTQMEYATNTSSDVVKVEGKYYLCQDAVWFVSSSPSGPWAVCKDVPAAVYTIPATSPVYRVTYVTVKDDDHDDDSVVCSYTAGYFGAFVAGLALGDCLVWGTGYYSPPYIGTWGPYPAYYPYHYSYGSAAVYNRWTGGYAVGARVYGPYASAGSAAWYNPGTGRYGRAARVEGPYGARTVAGAYNPRTGNGWATRQGTNGYAQWGASAARVGDHWVQSAHVAGPDGGVAKWHGSDGAGRFHWSDQGSGGMAVHNGDFYAGHDGNVYRKDDGQWSKWENGGWQSAGHNADGIRPDARPDNRPDGRRGDSFISGETRHTPDTGRNGFISGETRQTSDAGRNGFISGQTRHVPSGETPRPGADGGGIKNPVSRPGAGGAGERQPVSRPGQGGSGTQRPSLPARHVTDNHEVQQRLNRESFTRSAGEHRTQQYHRPSTSSFNRSSSSSSRSRSFGGGGGGRRSGGGFHRR